MYRMIWPAQDFGFRGDNYITKIVRVMSLARDTLSGPSLLPTKYYKKCV